MMSQICCNSCCSLPASASAWLHPLSARKARFNRRNSLLMALSLPSSAGTPDPGWVGLDAKGNSARGDPDAGTLNGGNSEEEAIATLPDDGVPPPGSLS